MGSFALPCDFPQDLTLKIKKSARFRALKLKFDLQGNLVLNIPKYATNKMGEDFIKEHLGWILERFKRLKACNIDTNKIYLFGLWLNFDDLQLLEPLPEVFVKWLINATNAQNFADAIKILWQGAINGNVCKNSALVAFYKYHLAHYMDSNLQNFIAKMQTPSVNICYGKSYYRLGSCCAPKKQIRFSLILSLFPKYCIDSVIIHELAHLTHQNHSKNFWNLVYCFDENPKVLDMWLKNNYEQNLYLYKKIFKG